MTTTDRRYALRCDNDLEAGTIYSTGGVWNASLPDDSKLLTLEQAQEFQSRHPRDTIVDVLDVRARGAVYIEGFRSVIPYDFEGATTPELREAARNAGLKALAAAGYAPAL